MEQAKKILMELQEKVSIIDDILEMLSSREFEGICEPKLISDLHFIVKMISSLDLSSTSTINYISNIITDDIYITYTELKEIVKNTNLENNTVVNDKRLALKNIVNDLENNVEIIKRHLQYYTTYYMKYHSENCYKNHISDIKKLYHDYITDKNIIYNSEDYYNHKISETQKQKEKLEEALSKTQNKKNNIPSKSQEEKEITEKEIQLQIANQQIQNYQIELEKKKKQENAIEEWNTKIKATFGELKEYLLPIKNEHKRLKYLFWTYLTLTGVVILLIVILEFVICYKFYNAESFPEWKNYLVLMFPISVTGGLLWAFISQLNRAQRQLVVLAKHIHEIEYIEGMLLSLNSLSTDINDSMKRVNSAIDRLLDNHLSSGEKHGKYDEESIVKEEKKDMIPTDVIFKLLKEIKGLSS